MKDKLIKLQDVIDLFIEDGDLKGYELIERVKPGHGSCCCCQACGRYHDDCVCYHNELLQSLFNLETI